MHIRTTDEVIVLAEKFIAKNGIVDEDVKQDIYIKALESRDLKRNQQVTDKFAKIMMGYISEDYISVVDTSTISPFDPFKSVEHDLLHEQLIIAMCNISDKEKKVLKLRFDDNMTLKSVGEELHYSSERIRQIERKALRKMRQPSSSKLIKDFLIEEPMFSVAKNNYRRVEYN